MVYVFRRAGALLDTRPESHTLVVYTCLQRNVTMNRRTHKCGGKCGKLNCAFETPSKFNFNRHIHPVPIKLKKVQCPHCPAKRKVLSKHIRRMHPEKYKRKIHPCPFPNDPFGWAFIKELVKSSDSSDRRRIGRWSKQDREELLRRNNDIRHDNAIQMYHRWKSMGDYDDAGGYIKGGLHLRSFSLHKLSADRINNNRPHFIGNGLGNLYFVSSGINSPCNIVSRYGKNTCAFLRERSRKPITDSEIETILQRERKATSKHDGKWVINVVYSSCNNAYRKDGHKYFESLDEMFKYVYDLLVEQRAICPVTDFLMDEHCGTKKSKEGQRMFKPSLNAKVPSLEHSPGNLEWVCAFVNSADREKQNDINDGVPTGWLNPIFKSYIGI